MTRWSKLLPAVGATLVVALAVALVLWDSARHRVPDGEAIPLAAPVAAVEPTVQEPVVATGSARVATADAPHIGSLIVTTAVDSLQVFSAPDGAVTETLGRTSTYGLPGTLLAVSDGTEAEGWVRVQLPNRAGHEYGWVRESDVILTESSTRVDIYLDDHQVDVTVDGAVVLTTTAAVGSPRTPTPLGLYYVTDPIDLASAPDGVYGPFILGLSGYSEVLTTFNGGAPQLAIHGTNAPTSIGTSVSNGCIRVPNDTILQMSALVPLGTPVAVHAARDTA